jgi:hypothetical protein
MDEKELKAIFEQLETEGWQPRLCDTNLPFYDRSVPCGEPNEIGDDTPESILWPRDLLSMHPEFTIACKGDSMIDAGLESGDVVTVICDVVPQDGDIVLACIDGESTIKVYCEDDEGFPWLLPQNKAYKPIMLKDKTNVRIIGRVEKIVKNAPRVAYRECVSAIKEAKRELMDQPEITSKKVRQAIIQVAPMVKNGRQWYAVFRALVDKKLLGKTDYESFCQLVASNVSQHEHLPVADQMQRLASQTFSKSIVLWDKNDAPVKGKPFDDYKRIAEKTLALLS